MGEARLKSRTRAEILAGEPRCIYCNAIPNQLEHMPPKSMFKGRGRPHGMEFAACQNCNNGTSAADLVASFVARISPDIDDEAWRIIEAKERRGKLEQIAPGFLNEFFRPDTSRSILLRKQGLLVPYVRMKADGPLLKGYLTTFAAKMGMALYREHIGSALPMEGGVQVNWFLNAGLAHSTADAMLKIMPAAGSSRQGKVNVGEQFFYRYNTDKRSIVAALLQFHRGLYLSVIATSEPNRYQFPRRGVNGAFIRPGELLRSMPSASKLGLSSSVRGP